MTHFGVGPEEVTPLRDEDFIPIGDRNSVQEAMARVEDRFFIASAGVDGLRSLDAPTRRSFARAAALAIEPYLTGDLDQLLEHVEQLGGELPTDDADDGERDTMERLRFLWSHQNERFGFVEIAPELAEVVTRSDNISLNARDDHTAMLRMGMEDPGGHITRTSSRFPGLKGWDKRGIDVYEARVPIRMIMKKSKDREIRTGMIGMYMGQDPQTGKWQPAVIHLHHDKKKDPVFNSIAEFEARMDFRPGNLHI